MNRQKTISIDVGLVDENRLVVPWLQTRETVRILGIIFVNSMRTMVNMNWDPLVSKTAQQIWLHSLRSLTLLQKVTLLNTYITSKMWYVASVVPPHNIHIAKITSTIGSYLRRGLPARVPIQQLARSIEKGGGINLQLPVYKCKALLTNRHLQESSSMPFYNSILSQTHSLPADVPCVRQIQQTLSALPIHIRQNPSSELIQRFLLEQTDQPRVERHYPALNWRRIWNNINDHQLSSEERSGLFRLVNEKVEHRRLLSIMHRADNTRCLHCNADIETITHKYSKCPRVLPAWRYMQQRMATVLGGWQRLTFEDLLRPELLHIQRQKRTTVLKLFERYIEFVDKVNERIDVGALEFYLVCG